MQVNISKYRKQALRKKMHKFGIRREDIREKFIRASGKGGQKVNKASSCVYLRHIPTNIEVKCKQERSQALNRLIAREILVNRIEAFIEKTRNQEKKRIEKIKRQQRKRSKGAKERILRAKRKRGEKKKNRSYRLKIEELAG